MLFVFFFQSAVQDRPVSESNPAAPEKIKIAACPTCFEAAKKLDAAKYQVILTASTAESTALLARGSVDLILAGRTLRPDEAAGDSLVLAEGYSFLASQPTTVYADELKDVIINTDIDPEKLSQELPGFSFEQVNDVYEYLEKGIILTSWDNTDYARADIVHVFARDGQRLALSRQPTLYCPTECDKEIASDIKSAFD